METVLEYKCPSCGGALSFDSGSQNMKCPYCETEIDVEALKQMDEALKDTPEDDMSWASSNGSAWQEGETENLRSYVCRSCGGEIVTEQTTSATSCPYCGNAVVLSEQLGGILRPDCIIPFKLDGQAAKAALLRHMKGKPLLPKAFKDENHIREVKGVYVPFWLFDSHAAGNGRYHGTRTRMWSDSRYYYTETKHYSIHRNGQMDFKAVPVDGSVKMDNSLMESLEPYDLSQAVDFQTAYLAGYYADKYDVTSQECAPRANERIKSSMDQSLKRTIVGFHSVITEHSSVQLSNTVCRYALYPVWLLSTQYKGKNYLFAMNGQTGKLVGDLPMDMGAFWRWWAMIAAGVSLLACAVYWFCF